MRLCDEAFDCHVESLPLYSHGYNLHYVFGAMGATYTPFVRVEVVCAVAHIFDKPQCYVLISYQYKALWSVGRECYRVASKILNDIRIR